MEVPESGKSRQFQHSHVASGLLNLRRCQDTRTNRDVICAGRRRTRDAQPALTGRTSRSCFAALLRSTANWLSNRMIPSVAREAQGRGDQIALKEAASRGESGRARLARPRALHSLCARRLLIARPTLNRHPRHTSRPVRRRRAADRPSGERSLRLRRRPQCSTPRNGRTSRVVRVAWSPWWRQH